MTFYPLCEFKISRKIIFKTVDAPGDFIKIGNKKSIILNNFLLNF